MIVGIVLDKCVVTLVDHEDAELFERFRWHVRWCSGKPYVYTSIYLHRLIAGRTSGDNQLVDHKDGNSLNNAKANLRTATVSQNAKNKRKQKGGTSKYKGVRFLKRPEGCWLARPWLASIFVKGRSITLGYFATEEEAAQQYNEAAREHYGEFAWLNKIEGSVG